MGAVKKVIDTLTGKALAEALEENKRTAADLQDALKRAREQIDAKRNAEEAAAHGK